MESITGRLEDWVIDPIYRVIWGFIFEDDRKRFSNGTWIHTSSIPDFTPGEYKKGDLVKTLNSLYILGEPKEN